MFDKQPDCRKCCTLEAHSCHDGACSHLALAVPPPAHTWGHQEPRSWKVRSCRSWGAMNLGMMLGIIYQAPIRSPEAPRIAGSCCCHWSAGRCRKQLQRPELQMLGKLGGPSFGFPLWFPYYRSVDPEWDTCLFFEIPESSTNDQSGIRSTNS